MEIHQIRYAEAVAHYSNFSRAADSLFVTQPTLSQQIRRLEEELGFPIFQRTTRTVAVTDKGRQFLKYAAPLLRAYDTLTLEAEKLRDDPGLSLQVGVLPTFAHLNILDIIHQFQSQHRDISVNLQIYQSNALREKLMNGQLDIIIANIFDDQLENLEQNIRIRIISRDVICVVAHESNPLAQKDALRLEDLNGREIIMLSKASSVRRHMDAAFKKAGIRPQMVLECPDIHSLMGTLQSDCGVSFLSSKVAAHCIAPPVITVPLIPDIKTMTAILFRENDQKSHILEQFSEIIRQSFQAE